MFCRYIAEGNLRWTNISSHLGELGELGGGGGVANGVSDSLSSLILSPFFPFHVCHLGCTCTILNKIDERFLSSPPNERMESSIPFHSVPAISTETGFNFGPVVIIAVLRLYLHFVLNYVIVALNLCFCFSKNANNLPVLYLL